MASPRRDASTASPRRERSDDTAAPDAGRERRRTPSAADRVPGRFRDDRSRPVPPRTGEHYQPRYRRPYNGTNIVYVPYATPVYVEREVVVERDVVDESASAPIIVEQPLPARLVLDIHPPTAQVFADGYYIGIPEDFRFEDGGAVMEPGPRRIDILARDHEPVSFDVNLTRGQSATFRHTLTPIMRGPQAAPDDTVKAPPAAKEPVTFYLIPGCYMGNVPPKEANLPSTCDIARAVSVQGLIIGSTRADRAGLRS